MRVFIAVNLPDEIKQKIAEAVNELKQTTARVKWVEANNLHLTLKFLGEVEEEKIKAVLELAEKSAAGFGGFKARVEGLGAYRHVAWVGLNDGDGLAKLALKLEKNFAGAGFRREGREFSSHVTIGRMKEDKGVDDLIKRMKQLGTDRTKFGEFLIDRIEVMKSTLTEKGPVYELLKEVSL